MRFFIFALALSGAAVVSASGIQAAPSTTRGIAGRFRKLLDDEHDHDHAKEEAMPPRPDGMHHDDVLSAEGPMPPMHGEHSEQGEYVEYGEDGEHGKGRTRRERSGERRERGLERRERDGERRERDGERRERGMGDDGGYGGGDGGPPAVAEKPSTPDLPSDRVDQDRVMGLNPMPGPRPAPGPEGPPLPGAGTPPAPRPGGPPSVVIPGDPAATGPGGPPSVVIPGGAAAAGPGGPPSVVIPGGAAATGPGGPPSVVIPTGAAATGPSGALLPPGRDLARAPTNLQDGPNYAGPNGPLSAIENFNNSEDGLITEEEVDAYILGNRDRVIGIPAFFYESDTNGDLQLTPDELAVVDPIGAFDGTDENPADGIVTEEEVLTWSNSPGRAYRAIGVKAFWQEIDTNGDNVVDEDEIQAAHDSGYLAWD